MLEPEVQQQLLPGQPDTLVETELMAQEQIPAEEVVVLEVPGMVVMHWA
jgi:hypothetical protein